MFYTKNISDVNGYLGLDESRHCIKVLRKRTGDQIQITDGQGTLYEVRITRDDFRKCEFSVESTTRASKEQYYTHIAIAPTKNLNRMEFLVEKATEAGVSEISFVLCEHSERRKMNIERLEKVAISAMKQSGRLFLPKLNDLQKLTTLLSQVDENQNKLIAYVETSKEEFILNSVKAGSSNLILIGPEGDFSKSEIADAESRGFKKVNLGNFVLRTETAALYSVISISALNNYKK